MRTIRILAIALFAALAACNIYFDDSGRHPQPDSGSDLPPDAGHVPDGVPGDGGGPLPDAPPSDGGFPFPDAATSDGGCGNDGGGPLPDAAPADGGSAPDGHCC